MARTSAQTDTQANAIQKPLNGLELFQANNESGFIPGFDDISAEDIKMPRIKLCQPTSKEVGDEKCKAGEFYNITTGDTYPELNVRLLSVSKGRTMWPEQFKRGDSPICRSNNGRVSTDGKSCSTCENCRWNGNERPLCNQTYTWLGLLDDDAPFRMSASGAAISNVKTFITECTRHNVPPFTFKVKIVAEKQTNDKGTYYTPKYEIQKTENGAYVLPTKEQWNAFKETMEGLKSMFQRAVEADLMVNADDTEVIDAEGELF